MRTDINYYTSKIIHENDHHNNFLKDVWGGAQYNPAEDIDQDLLRDIWEFNTLYPIPEGTDHWDYFDEFWLDPKGYNKENAAYLLDAFASHDWACPGKQF
jgi:hypothetical protein